MMSRALCLLFFLSACGGAEAPAADGGRDSGPVADAGPVRQVTLTIDGTSSPHSIDERFLSVAVGSAQISGGKFWAPGGGGTPGGRGDAPVPPYDFASPRIRALAAALAPAYLRIGGSDADVSYYDFSDAPVTTPPEPYELVLTRAQWDGMADFARDLDYRIVFTFNAGPGPRDAGGMWLEDQARIVLDHIAARGDPVEVVELGNEPNAFPVIHGLGFRPSAANMADAYLRFAALARARLPGVRVGGPAAAYWPTLEEINPVTPSYFSEGLTGAFDVISWHYYPQQSVRCPFAVRRASPYLMLEPASLDEILLSAEIVERQRDTYAPGAPIWIGESGHAQCGGEPGVSSAFVATFWWLDQLGLAAREGIGAVIRQTLSGSDYGLIDDVTLEPRPDYWASVLWRRLMGTRVLTASSGDPLLRTYAHCARGGAPGAVVALAINLDRDRGVELGVGSAPSSLRQVYLLTAPDLFADRANLNGLPLALAGETLPALEPLEVTDTAILLPPASIAFVVLPDAGAPACR